MPVRDYPHQGVRAGRMPRPPNQNLVVKRPRVIELIENRTSAALCIVRAPRNFGKSVAIQQWAAETTRDTCWLTATEHCSTPQTFWQLLAATLDSHLGKDTAETNTPELLADPVEYISASLAGTQALTVVVEDFHWIQQLKIERSLAELLAKAPELSFLIAARAPTHFEQIQWSMNLDLQVIAMDELLFNDAEAAKFHAESPLEPISAELNAHFQGVPQPHRIAQQVAEDPRPPTATHAEHIIARVTDTVRSAALVARRETLDRDTTKFLAVTLPLRHFDLALVQLLAPEVDAETIILAMADFGLLTSQNMEHGRRYSFRPIAKDAYTAILAPEITIVQTQVWETAVAFEVARKEFSPAFSYAMATKDYRLCTDILLQSGLRLLADKDRVLQASLPQIPKTQLVKYPLLTVALGIIYNSTKRTRLKGLEHFALALTSTRLLGRAVPPEERLAVNLAQTTALRIVGQFGAAASTARDSLKSVYELPLADSDRLRIFETIALGQWGLTLLFVGDFTAATRALHHSIAAGDQIASPQAQYFATSVLAYRYAIDGDLATAAIYAEIAAEQFAPTALMELYQQTPLIMANALIELGRLRPEAAEAYLSKVLSETSTSEFWGQLRVIEAKIDILRGHAGIASGRMELVLRSKKELPALNPMDAADLKTVRSYLLLASGKVAGAKAVFHKSAKNISSEAAIARARICLAVGQAKEVVELLSPALHFPTALQSAEAQSLLTVARLQLQPLETVRPDVESLAGTLIALHNSWPLALLPVELLDLLSSAVEQLKVPFPDLKGLPRTPFAQIASRASLTPREASILAALAVTGDRAEIAQANFVSVNTVKSQLRSLYRKLGVTRREDALLAAAREGLLDRHSST